MKRLIKIVATTLCAGMVLSSGLFARSPVVMAAGEVAINEFNFPDENFRKYVKENCDSNYDGVLSQAEINARSSITLSKTEIVSLKGIEYFTALRALNCNWNSNLTSLDVSKNVALEGLACFGNQLTNIDVSQNTELYWLNCSMNKITSLDVSKNIKLIELHCYDNQLTSLDVSKNVKLEALTCEENQLTSLDVSNNVKLEALACNVNQLTSLDVSRNVALTKLSCFANQLTSLDVSKNVALTTLKCYMNDLTSLDVSKNVALKILQCECNQLTSLDVSKNVNLEELICYYNQLASLNMSNCIALSKLNCTRNPLTNLDISSNDNLYVICSEGKFINGYLNGYIRWYYYDDDIYIDPQTTLIYNGQILYAPTNQPAVSPTPVPTAGPIPTAAPTPQASKSVGSFVNRCYEVALGREADEGGYNYWLDALNNGEICGAQAGYGFIFSGEYANKKTTNEEFVTDLYSMYFGRTPDSAGFNYWVGLLNSGASREEIFAGFANSTEFDNLCSDYGVVTGAYIVGVPNDQQGGVNAFVARLYNICLTRRPDQAGQAGWSQKLIAGDVTGTTCAYGFVFSPEFIGKEPSNEEFVACMYRAFFGREADEAGFAAWVSTLNGGGFYEDVFNGFTGSAEFANLCASYGIQT